MRCGGYLCWLCAALLLPVFAFSVDAGESADGRGVRVTVEAGSGDAVLVRRARAAVTGGAARIEEVLGVVFAGEVRVKVVHGGAAFAAACGGKMPEWAMAVAVRGANVVVVDAARAAPATANDFNLTMLHEMVHLALFQVEGRRSERLPVWFHEGVAQWLSGQSYLRGRRVSFMSAAAAGGLIPFAELAGSFPRAGDRAALAYAQSEVFVGHLARRYSAAALRQVVAGYGRGLDFDAAFEEALGVSWPLMEAEWAAGFRGTRAWLRVVWEVLGLTGLMAVLTIVVWLVVRRRARKQHEVWERDEAWSVVLDEESPPAEESVEEWSEIDDDWDV